MLDKPALVKYIVKTKNMSKDIWKIVTKMKFNYNK